MPNVVNVRFRSKGKAYFFDPAGTEPRPGDSVIVETAKGVEMGECVRSAHFVEETAIVPPLRPVLRIATEADLAVYQANREKEKTAFDFCQKKIEAHGLDMKLVDVEYSFDGSKILFFFTSDGRVDFRELVKDLASVFRTRIELRQIGVRDSAKLVGGLGICGRPFCCTTFLDDFQPVSIKMAKTQSLSLNPTKISGTCGRLMCCLKYEQEAYEHLLKSVPKVSSAVDTPDGKGTVTEVNLLRRTVKVKLADETVNDVRSYPARALGFTVGGVYKEPEPPEEEEIAPAEPSFGKGYRYYGGLDPMPALSNEISTPAEEEEKSGREHRHRSGRRHRSGKKGHGESKPGEQKAPQGEQKPKQGKQNEQKPKQGEHKPKQNEHKPKQGEHKSAQGKQNEHKPRQNEQKPRQGEHKPPQGEQKPRQGKQNEQKPRQENKSGRNRKPQGEGGKTPNQTPLPADDKARARAAAVAEAVAQAKPGGGSGGNRNHRRHRGGSKPKTEKTAPKSE